jgi:hypothetical protein
MGSCHLPEPLALKRGRLFLWLGVASWREEPSVQGTGGEGRRARGLPVARLSRCGRVQGRLRGAGR